MKTNHTYHFKDSGAMNEIPDKSIQLVVTSPPYPMIEMWDELFASRSTDVAQAIENGNRLAAYEAMHKELDKVWKEVCRVLAPGCFACINIGDATRTISGHFMLYPNHARILSAMINLGFTPLPEIVWRKQSNAPNKFMGSGMLPAGAYVTQEHEYILILRKGDKREFHTDEAKKQRHASAFFWEERNTFFSDVWFDLLGTRQGLEDKDVRMRSAAYPFELPYRLINMYSLKGDTVLDPFFGVGTTMLAAMAAGRNSIGYELSEGFGPTIESRTNDIIAVSNERISTRLENHMMFVKDKLAGGKEFKHTNEHYLFPVVTNQERGLLINEPETIVKTGINTFEVTYSDAAPKGVIDAWERVCSETPPPPQETQDQKKPRKLKEKKAPKQKEKKTPHAEQLELF
ncbi:MAG: site-specific DNA-methyltransferase [Desulfobacteraceae bacterium]